MLKNLLRQECAILDEVVTGLDEFGDQVKDYVTNGFFKCRVDPNASTELELDRDTRVTFQRIFLDETAAGMVDALSVIAVTDGKTYQTYGDPQVFYSRSVVNHIEVMVRIIEG